MKLRVRLIVAIFSSGLLLAGCRKKEIAAPPAPKPVPAARTEAPQPKPAMVAEPASAPVDEDMTDEEEPIAPNIDTAVPADAGDPPELPAGTPPGAKPGKGAKPKVKPKK